MSSPTASATAAADPSLLYLIKQLELATRARLDDICRPIGMTALQYTALTVLERRPDLSAAQLARNSFVTDQSMADMVTALEARRLIVRHRDEADRRRRVIALTAAGRALLQKYRRQVDRIEADMLADLRADEADALRQGLEKCRSALAARRGGNAA